MDLVSSILEELSYTTTPRVGDFFSMLYRESEDYFIIAEYEPDELAEFFTNPKTKSIIKYFQAEKSKNSAINKNSSLVILVKTENLAETLETHKNNIFDIEEDEYILRKYVLVYTASAVDEIAGKNIAELNDIVKDVSRFANYQAYETRFNDQAYFLTMQLFVKLPPLSFSGYENDFESIRDRIDASIGKSGTTLAQHILETTNLDVKANRTALLDTESDDFDEWVNSVMAKVNDETS